MNGKKKKRRRKKKKKWKRKRVNVIERKGIRGVFCYGKL